MYTLLALRNGSPALNYEKAYTSLTLLALLQAPMALVLDAIAGVVSAFGAIERIGEYVSRPTTHTKKIAGDGINRLSMSPMPKTCEEKEKPAVVHARDFSAGWDVNQTFVIRNLNFTILSSSITFIVGPVACGKTTLLHSILGEVKYNEGTLQVSATRAGYCCQTPWITNDTIQHNIIGTNLFVQSWYERVVDACVLRDELESFPCGDQVVVGNNGTALSGGQKTRLVNDTVPNNRQFYKYKADMQLGNCTSNIHSRKSLASRRRL